MGSTVWGEQYVDNRAGSTVLGRTVCGAQHVENSVESTVWGIQCGEYSTGVQNWENKMKKTETTHKKFKDGTITITPQK